MKRYFLFFDFDGVLLSWRDWQNPNYSKDTKVAQSLTSSPSDYSLLNSCFNKLNNNILPIIDDIVKDCKGEVYFIPISSWGKVLEKSDCMQRLFDICNIKKLKSFVDEPICDTNGIHIKDTLKGKLSRPLFIKDYIKRYKPTDYIIFDDEFFIGYMKYRLNFIPCDIYEGITFKSISIFRNYVEKFWTKSKLTHSIKIDTNLL